MEENVVWTSQPCSEVIFLADPMPSEVLFQCRSARAPERKVRAFSMLKTFNYEKLKDKTNQLIFTETYALRKQRLVHAPTLPQASNQSMTIKKKVKELKLSVLRRKKLKITKLYNSGVATIQELIRMTGFSRKFIQKTVTAIEVFKIEPIDWAQQARDDKEEFITSCLADQDDPFFTAPSIRRKARQTGLKLSRQRIRRTLHRLGYNWKSVLWKPKSSYRPINQETLSQAKEVVGTVVEGMALNPLSIVFCDEIKLPVKQVPIKFWGLKYEHPSNKRVGDDTLLTTIASCTVKGFYAVQFFLRELKSQDYLYYWSIVNKRYHSLFPSFRVLMDSAPWHTEISVRTGSLSNRWLYNVKHLYRLNLIEACFSYVRARWRERKNADTVSSEGIEAIRIFLSFNEEGKYEGFHRNFLRGVLQTLEEIAKVEGSVVYSLKDR